MEDEYEYAPQQVTPEGKGYPANIYGGIRYQWFDREWAKDVLLNVESDAREEGDENSTFRLVRRKMAGPIEVDPDVL